MIEQEERKHLISLRLGQAEETIQEAQSGIFSPEIGRYLKTAFETRTNSDYKVNRTPTAADLEALLVDMKTFISTIKIWLEANPA